MGLWTGYWKGYIDRHRLIVYNIVTLVGFYSLVEQKHISVADIQKGDKNMAEKQFLTKKGYDERVARLEELKVVRRKEVAQKLKEAREIGRAHV